MAGYPLPTATEESEIVSGCRAGDKEAFDALYRRYAPVLRSYCLARLRSPDHVEDVVHEALIRAYEALPRFRRGARFWPYLATVAANLCVDEQRRDSRFSDDPTEERVGDGLEEEFERSERTQLVRDALPLIPSRYRTLLELQGIEGWSLSEIAELEGLSMPAVKTTLMRARRALKRSVSELAGRRGGWPLAGVGFLPSFKALRVRLANLGERVRRLGLLPQSGFALQQASEAVAALAAAALVVSAMAVPSVGSKGVYDPPAAASSAGEPTKGGGSTARAPGGVVSDLGTHASRVISPGENAQPEDASLNEITASPSYQSDGTLFASGVLSSGCGRPSCPVLFRSTDGGESWSKLPATGFAGGSILLPPSFPEDSRIFASTPAGLQVSLDTGVTFLTLTPFTGPAAISPRFDSADPRILIGSTPSWEWRDDLKLAQPLASQVLGKGAVNFAFAPSSRDRRIFAGAATASLDSIYNAGVFVCGEFSECRLLSRLQGAKGSPRLTLSPAFVTDSTIFAVASRKLYVSDDSVAFRLASSPPGLVEIALHPGFGFETSTIYAATLSEGQTHGGVWRSIDFGFPWERLTTLPNTSLGAAGLLVTPSGQILALIAANDRGVGGFACSSDGGITWASRCTRLGR